MDIKYGKIAAPRDSKKIQIFLIKARRCNYSIKIKYMLFFHVFDIPLKKHFVFTVEKYEFIVVRTAKLLKTYFKVKRFLFDPAFKVPYLDIVRIGRKKKFFIWG